MKNEELLHEYIEKLANRKADAHVRRMWAALKNASAQTGNATRPGDGTWFGETWRSVVTVYVQSLSSKDGDPRLPESKEMKNHYRAVILEEVLEKLPLVKELVMMEESEP